tara:strand:- start:121 stop:339 length:219 start_codon:yes stop_codon:yes gene_type:complete
MTKIQENDVVRDLTAEEENQLTTDNALSVVKQTARVNEATAKATAQASGNTKLLALGLSQEEATAITGYTPE